MANESDLDRTRSAKWGAIWLWKRDYPVMVVVKKSREKDIPKTQADPCEYKVQKRSELLILLKNISCFLWCDNLKYKIPKTKTHLPFFQKNDQSIVFYLSNLPEI